MTQSPHGFAASLFHPDYGGDPVGGRLFPNRDRLQFQAETISLEIPLADMEVELERGGPGLFFSDAHQPDARIYLPNQTILRHPALKAQPQVAALLGRRELQRALRLTAWFAAGFAVVVWLASLATSAMVGAIAARVPAQWGEKIGGEVITNLRSENLLLDDTNDCAQLDSLAAPLIQVLPADSRSLQFYVAKNPLPNAFALPGGAVVVNQGLLQLTGDPDEILGVLAHELAHQTRRHVIRRAIAAAGPLVIFGVFLHSSSGAGNLLALGSGLMAFQEFSRDYETEADDTGWDYLVAANIDPRGMIHVFQKLEAVEGKLGMKSVEPQALRSHPDTAKRIARLQKKWDKLPRKSGFLDLPSVNWTIKVAEPLGKGP